MVFRTKGNGIGDTGRRFQPCGSYRASARGNGAPQRHQVIDGTPAETKLELGDFDSPISS
jgi:hypothetical protein